MDENSDKVTESNDSFLQEYFFLPPPQNKENHL